jgi:large subunit ribosomal protein L6
MSRIGAKPIAIPAQVQAAVRDRAIAIQGPLGALEQSLPEGIQVTVGGGRIAVQRGSDEKQARAFHGLTRSLINNMVIGVTKGFDKNLEIHGVGYNIKVQGSELLLNLGFADAVKLALPPGIKVEVAAPTNPARFTIRGCDKQQVGEFAARIRRLRPPEPYQGKGVRYADERIRRKAGKTFAATG